MRVATKTWMVVMMGAIAAGATGCSGSDAEAPTDADESDIRVAQCPNHVDLAVAKPAVYKSAPRKTSSGQAFSRGQTESLERVMAQARTLGDHTFSLSLERAANGRCSYRGADAQATFRTTGGKNVFQVFAVNNLQFFAFPTSYSKSGLQFEDGAHASLFASIVVGDSAFASVKIGSAPVLAGSTAPTLTVSNRGDVSRLDAPDAATIVARGGAVTATVTSETLATCEITKVGGNAAETRFKVSVQYELDDGFNGCTIALAGSGFSAKVTLGTNVD